MDQHTELERRQRKTEDAHESHKHFQVLYSETRANELHKKNLAKGLTTDESLTLMALGNHEHMEKIKQTNASPSERHQKITSGQADYLVIACSDARIPKLDSEEDPLVGIQIRIAGNIIPKPGTPAFEEIREAVNMVKEDGLILVEGHCNCGACKERVKWVEGGMKPTGSKELDSLLNEVFGSSPEDNAMAQITKAREKIPTGSRATGAVVYDWEKGGIQIVSDNNSPIMEILVANWNRRHVDALEDGGLEKKLSKHKPHAIAVGTSDLPFSLATMLNASQNEVFSTTGSVHGLDELDKASILYAVEHLGVRHIPFIAPGEVKDKKKIKQMFDRWEDDLRSIKVDNEPVIARMIDIGQIKISRLRYDVLTGELKDI